MYNVHLRWQYRVFIGCAHPYTSVTRRTCWCPTTYSGQWGKKHFHRRYGATQAANHPSLAYYNTHNSIFNIHEPLMGSFVRCSIATGKSAFSPLTTVHCLTPACLPCNKRIWACAPSENSLYQVGVANQSKLNTSKCMHTSNFVGEGRKTQRERERELENDIPENHARSLYKQRHTHRQSLHTF